MRDRRLGQGGKHGGGVGRGAGAALVGAEQDLAEGAAFRQAVLVGVVVQPGLQLGLGRVFAGGAVLDQEFELLAHATTDDGVVGIEAHGDGFAIADFLADEIIDEGLEFLLWWAAAGEQDKALHDLVHAAFGYDDGIARRALVRPVDQAVATNSAAPMARKWTSGSRTARLRNAITPDACSATASKPWSG